MVSVAEYMTVFIVVFILFSIAIYFGYRAGYRDMSEEMEHPYLSAKPARLTRKRHWISRSRTRRNLRLQHNNYSRREIR